MKYTCHRKFSLKCKLFPPKNKKNNVNISGILSYTKFSNKNIVGYFLEHSLLVTGEAVLFALRKQKKYSSNQFHFLLGSFTS